MSIVNIEYKYLRDPKQMSQDQRPLFVLQWLQWNIRPDFGTQRKQGQIQKKLGQ